MIHSTGNSTQLQIALQRVLDNQLDAFDDLALLAGQRLKNLTRSMLRRYPHVKRWEDTDDVYQAALIRLHRSIGEVQPDSPRAFFGLAVTQIRRSLIDLARHYYGPHGLGKNYRSEGGGKAADDSGGRLHGGVGRVETPDNLACWSAFHEAIDALPNDEREVFELIWYGGLIRKDVAKLLGVAEKTVLRRMNRARIQLHELMAGQRPE